MISALSAVVETDREGQPRVVGGEFLGVAHVAQQAARNAPVPPAREANPHALGVELVPVAQEDPLGEVHEEPHFVGGRRQFSVEKA